MIKQCIGTIMAIACLCGYKGKTNRLIVAFSAGGGYDDYSRTIGRHLSKNIRGNPSIVVENMTGAGGPASASIAHANARGLHRVYARVNGATATPG
jgi:tripartite-type tricarboxylate transporter receptor subunit TctC